MNSNTTNKPLPQLSDEQVAEIAAKSDAEGDRCGWMCEGGGKQCIYLAGHQEPTPMAARPPIAKICYISAEGNPHSLIVGSGGITEIRETQECGEYCHIPWLEVWSGDSLFARFNQHKVEHLLYGGPQ